MRLRRRQSAPKFSLFFFFVEGGSIVILDDLLVQELHLTVHNMTIRKVLHLAAIFALNFILQLAADVV